MNRLPPPTDEDRDRWAEVAAEAARSMHDLMAEHLKPDQVKAIAKEAAVEAAHEALDQFFQRLGIDQDVKSIREEVKDRLWVRTKRENEEAALKHGKFAAMTVIIGGVLLAFWLGFKGIVGGVLK